MTARFAGSRTLDDRRRRWLASGESDSAETSPASQPTATTNENSATEQDLLLTAFPLRKLISSRGWKVAAVVTGVAVLAGLILAGEIFAVDLSEKLGPGWATLYDNSGVPLTRICEAGLLLASAQIALLICWARSQSLRDFHGQYRVWWWAAGGIVLVAGGLLGRWHWAWSQTVCWFWLAEFPEKPVVCWLLPMAVIAGVLWKQLRAEMKGCRASSIFLWIAGISFLVACAFRLNIDRTGWSETQKTFVSAGLQMAACVSVFASFLLHARYVIHISLEPPAASRTLWQRVFAAFMNCVGRLKFSWPKRSKKEKPNAKTASKKEPASKRTSRRKTRQAKKVEPKEPEATPDEEEVSEKLTETPPENDTTDVEPDPEPEPVKPSRRSAQKSRSRTASTQASKPAKPVVKEAPPEPEVKTPPAEPIAPEPEPQDSGEQNLRIDPAEPLDPAMLKGLSKKERRRLRKQHRDSQRQT